MSDPTADTTPQAAAAPSAGPAAPPLLAALVAGDRRALARAITLVESTRPDHRAQAAALLTALPPRQALRIGLSGTPGVGKSTFIEAFGLMLTARGLRVAVLAVDPSSARSGGSILGDKTRMERLSRDPRAFIRPSPSRAELGGVGRRTREAVRLAEAAGHDVVLIETVGVGQSETLVADMTDLFVLLLAPAGGDELQGVKRGIMEMADLILVNKADGELKPAALRTVADYAGALRLLRKRPQDPPGFPKAMPVSAVDGAGLDKAWAEMQALAQWRRDHGHFTARRAEQAESWFRSEVRAGLLARLDRPPAARRMAELGKSVAAGCADPAAAAAEMLGRGGTCTVEILTWRLRPGTGAALDRIMRDSARALHDRLGIRIVAAAPSDTDPDSYVLIRAFDDPETMRAQLDALDAHPDWQGPRDALAAAAPDRHSVVLTLPRSAAEAMDAE